MALPLWRSIACSTLALGSSYRELKPTAESPCRPWCGCLDFHRPRFFPCAVQPEYIKSISCVQVPIKDAAARKKTADEAALAFVSHPVMLSTGSADGDSEGGASSEGGSTTDAPLSHPSFSFHTPVRRAAAGAGERDQDRRGGGGGVTPTPLRRGARNMAWPCPSPRLLRVSEALLS